MKKSMFINCSRGLVAVAIVVATQLNSSGQDVTGTRLNVGTGHNLSGTLSSIAGGLTNRLNGNYSTIGGGILNTNGGEGNVVGGGEKNHMVGTYNFLGGGLENSVPSDFAVVGGGYLNTNASVAGTVGGGSENFITGCNFGSILGGWANVIDTAEQATLVGGLANRIRPNATSAFLGGGYANIISNSAEYSTLMGGYGNVISGSYSTIGGGFLNHVKGTVATVVGGANGFAYLYGQVAHASGSFGDVGDAQTSEMTLFRQTTSTNLTELFLDGAAARMVLRTNSVWTFDISVSARAANGDSGGFKTNGVIKSVNGALTLYHGPISVPAVASDVGAWTVTLSADAANHALAVKVTGNSSTNRWMATVRTTELKY